MTEEKKDPFEKKASEVFGEIIKFIKENPDQCKSDNYNFWVGATYEFWIANGFEGDAFRASSISGNESIPRQFFTQKQKHLFQVAYHDWLKNHYKAPKIKLLNKEKENG